MAKGNNQKLKLLYMAKIFSEKTDENHGISVQEMISLLNQYEINADRKTIYLDFEELWHFGMDIVSNQEGHIKPLNHTLILYLNGFSVRYSDSMSCSVDFASRDATYLQLPVAEK